MTSVFLFPVLPQRSALAFAVSLQLTLWRIYCPMSCHPAARVFDRLVLVRTDPIWIFEAV